MWKRVWKERFAMREKEKHFFAVEWDIITKRIDRDGVMVANKLRFHSSLAKKFQFDIG
jgi:hypothetical protein